MTQRPNPQLGVFIVPDVRDQQWCDRIRTAMEQGHASPAELYADGYRVDEQARRALDVEIGQEILNDVQRTIDAIRPDATRFFGIDLTRNEGPGFLRYLTGGFYRRHCDVLSDSADEFPRRISVVLFLTSAGEQCEGGALRIYGPDAFDIAPKAGTLVAFPSDVPHEVLPVTAGVRDVVVDWLF